MQVISIKDFSEIRIGNAQNITGGTGCIQTEGTASTKKYGMDFLGTGKRLEKFTLS